MQTTNKHVQSTQKIARNTIVQYYEQYFVQNGKYFVQYRTVLRAIKAAKILCKNLCNVEAVEQYMNKIFVKIFVPSF